MAGGNNQAFLSVKRHFSEKDYRERKHHSALDFIHLICRHHLAGGGGGRKNRSSPLSGNPVTL